MKWKGEKSPLLSAHAGQKSETMKGSNKSKSIIENRSRITLKLSNNLPIFASYYALLCICNCFSHLTSLFSVMWLSLLYKFTVSIYFLFLSDEGPRLYYPYRQYTSSYFDLYLFCTLCHEYRPHVWSISSKYTHRASIFYFIYKIRLENMLWRMLHA